MIDLVRLGFLASGSGSNMQAIIDACQSGYLPAEPVVVIGNNSRSGALARAKQKKIANYHLSTHTHSTSTRLDQAICQMLVKHRVDWVILAGYMKKLGPEALATFRGRILNVHPSLLPRYGGQGMYGKQVHQAVLASGEKETGVTIHLVDGGYDTGPIVAQCTVPVLPNDTAETLAERVLKQEHVFFPETLKRIFTGNLKLAE